MGSLVKVLFGITWFILGCLFTYKAWYTVPIIYETMTSLTAELVLLKVLFWTGLAVVWMLLMIAVPVYTIIQGFNEE